MNPKQNLNSENKPSIIQFKINQNKTIVHAITCLYLKNVGTTWLEYFMKYSVSHPTVGVRNANTCNI